MSNNSRIYKNTAFLYLRMFVMMIISLYSSRVVLQVLGKSDFGLFSVVGGFIALFFFVSNSLSVATQRFMAYAIGENNVGLRKRVFSLSIVLYTLLSCVILFLGLIIGIPFVKYEMNIPAGREDAALYVFLISLITAVVGFIRIPYNASVIANEKMAFYSWISIVEAIIKLLVIYLLLVVSYDKLVVYAILQLFASVFITLAFVAYCNANFKDYTNKNIFDKQLLSKLSSFVGWNLYGGMADMTLLQGLSLLLNQFFGTIINTAQALANSIKAQIAAFVDNINVASGPAITKYYAEKKFLEVESLLFTISKMNYFVLLVISFPIMVILPTILDLWLGKGTYPNETIIFSRLILINTLIDTIPGASQAVVFASGKIGKYQFVVSSLKFISILVIYFVYYLHVKPEAAYYIFVVFAFPRIVYQIRYSCRLINTKISDYVRAVVYKDVVVTFITVLLSYSVIYLFKDVVLNSLLNNLLLGFIAFILTASVVYCVGLNKSEQNRIRKAFMKRIKSFWG